MTGTAQRSGRAGGRQRPDPSPVPGRLVAAARLCGLPRRRAATLVRRAAGRPGTTDDATLVAAVAAALPGALDAAPTAPGDTGPVGEAVRALPAPVRVAVALDAAVGPLAGTDPDLVAEGHRQLVPAVAPSALLWSRALDDVPPALEQALTALVPPPRRRRRPVVLATVAAIVVLAAAGGVVATRTGDDRTAAPAGSDRLPIWVAVLELGADPFALNPAAELVERVAGVNTFTDALECYAGLDVGPVDESTDWFLAVGSVDRTEVDVLVRALGRTPIVVARVVGTCTLPPPF